VRIAALFVHPIKSGRAVEVERAGVTGLGLEHDRRFMVVDPRGRFVTQREHPALARVSAHVEGNELHLVGDDRREVVVPTEGPGDVVRASVWGDDVEAIDCGAAAAGLLTNHLGTPARLVRMGASTARPVDPVFGQPGDLVSFADGFPLLIVTQASIRAVLAAAGAALDARRFRPNVVVEGAAAFDEDAWLELRLGEVRVDIVKPCGRCAMVDVDPDLGERAPGVLAELGRTRKRGGSATFGQNAIPRGEGTLHVGDEVVVTRRA
jgi:uncharacterized protein YcbX